MLITIKNILDDATLPVIASALETAQFIDGKLSAGKAASQVKNNREMDQQSETAMNLAKILVGNLYNNDRFRRAALPLRISQPVFARYEDGMTYGDHIDDPVMGDQQKFRCDIALTVFLSEPETYEGGELVVRTQFGEQQVKLAAGDMVLYPASSLHRVNPVKSGQRLVAVAWIQSMVRDPAKREILYEISEVREKLLFESSDSELGKQIDHSYVNLVRMWAEV
jgi:PKHD-type hydroxylase